jgi:hypothetical protein
MQQPGARLAPVRGPESAQVRAIGEARIRVAFTLMGSSLLPASITKATSSATVVRQ